MKRGKRNNTFGGSVYTAGGCAVLLFGIVASNIFPLHINYELSTFL